MLPKIEKKNNGKLINLLLQNRKDFLISYSVFVRAIFHIPTPMRFVLFLVYYSVVIFEKITLKFLSKQNETDSIPFYFFRLHSFSYFSQHF
jgi:hypothetical protein